MCSIEKINNVLDGPVSLLIGSLKLGLGPMVGVWLVVKATVSMWTAQTLVEESINFRETDTN
jgi:hypothetical protein